MPKNNKEAKYKAEKQRLINRYSELPEDALTILEGQIDQAAFLRIELEEMRKELGLTGWVEDFQNSPELPAFERERPLAKQYINTSRVYQNVIKQLDDKLYKLQPIESEVRDDGFDNFSAVFD